MYLELKLLKKCNKIQHTQCKNCPVVYFLYSISQCLEVTFLYNHRFVHNSKYNILLARVCGTTTTTAVKGLSLHVFSLQTPDVAIITSYSTVLLWHHCNSWSFTVSALLFNSGSVNLNKTVPFSFAADVAVVVVDVNWDLHTDVKCKHTECFLGEILCGYKILLRGNTDRPFLRWSSFCFGVRGMNFMTKYRMYEWLGNSS